ncbi:hypothetical protein FI667_g5623, partial [Globisporangium splendens]
MCCSTTRLHHLLSIAIAACVVTVCSLYAVAVLALHREAAGPLGDLDHNRGILRDEEIGQLQQRSLVDIITDVNKTNVEPRVATYRNGYGTHFTCTTTCHFILMGYLVTLAGFLGVLFLTPVQSSSQSDSLPFRLWFGDDDTCGSKPAALPTDQVEQLRSSWLRWGFFWKTKHQEPSEVKGDDPSTARLLAERTSQMLEPPKTYESIGVDTDGLIASTGSLSSPTKRGSIFANAPPPQPKKSLRPKVVRTTSTDLLGSGGMSFVGSETSAFSDMTSISRTDTTRGIAELIAPPSAGEKKEMMVRTIERRASIQHRAEKRKEQAKSDISYENLRDEEIQMYEYLEFVRELLEGMVIKKVCQKSAKVVKRTFYINPDMSTVYWNKLGTKKWVNKKSSLDTSRIDKVLKGFHGNANVEIKGKSEKSMLYVSVLCTDGKHLDLEAKDEAMRQRLYIGFSRLATEKRQALHQHGTDVADSPMAVGRLPPVKQSNVDDDDEEEKPQRLDQSEDAARYPDLDQGTLHPEDTRAHAAADRGAHHSGQMQDTQVGEPPASPMGPHRHRRASTAPIHTAPLSPYTTMKHSDPETETESAAALLRELESGDLEEKEESNDE